MKIFSLKNLAAIAALGASLVASEARAQQAGHIYAVIAGSSAMFNSMAFAAFERNGTSYLCGTNHWTYKSTDTSASAATFVGIHDSRSSSIQDEPATVWVAWNNAEVGAAPVTGEAAKPRICAFVQVDSTVGVRAAFARNSSGLPAASLAINAALVGVAGANKVPNTTVQDVALPAAVRSDLSGAKITIAAADIRPEDAKFATTRTLIAQSAKVAGSLLTYVSGLGYVDSSSPSPSIGHAIKSSQSSTVANPVDFALIGKDPISGGAAPSVYTTTQVGAGPVIVFVNTSNSTAYHLGSTALTNISTTTLSKVLDGSLIRTRDLFPGITSAAPALPMTVFVREPLSGTYNTVEFNVSNNMRFKTSQERNVINVTPASGASDNPLNQKSVDLGGGVFSYRERVIGTGEMVSTVLKNADSLGYAFWGYGNFSKVANSSTARYLLVDGVDPLYKVASANPNGVGVFPLKNSTTGLYPVLPFPNIIDGSYPIWTIYRIVTTNPTIDKNEVTAFVTTAQTQAAKFSDFVPATRLTVFRSHFTQAGMVPANGHIAGGTEVGGDVGGQVFTIESDLDYIADTKTKGATKELINLHQ